MATDSELIEHSHTSNRIVNVILVIKVREGLYLNLLEKDARTLWGKGPDNALLQIDEFGYARSVDEASETTMQLTPTQWGALKQTLERITPNQEN